VQERRPVAARVAGGERSADGAAASHLIVGDAVGAIADNRHGRRQRGFRDAPVRGQGADGDDPARVVDGIEPGQTADVDHVGRLLEAQLHEHEQCLTARQQAGVLTEGRQKADRLIDGLGAMIVEG
jgi:hypothetical protein